MEGLAERVRYAEILLALGEIDSAEREVSDLLGGDGPVALTALSLVAKIKHIRGELSHAIACWTALHAQSPHKEVARTQLAALLRAADATSRLAGFDAGVDESVADAELTHALRCFLARRVGEARAALDRLAVRSRGRDGATFKLAMLAHAWICELSGDFGMSAAILEALGRERGFEVDVDRVLALARVYERIGSRDRLEKAAHIFRFLDRQYGKMSAVARLSSIHRRLGEREIAARYEARFLDEFRRRMHCPTAADAARVAASRFLPIEALSSARIYPSDFDEEAPLRERAVTLAVLGRIEPALAMLRDGDALIDAKYAANLAAILESRDADARLADVIAEDADDARFLGVALAYRARARADKVERVLRGSTRRPRAIAALAAAVERAPLRARGWRDLAEARELFGETREALRCEARAAALEESALRDRHAIGRAQAAAVYHLVGKSKGLIHQMWALRTAVRRGRGGQLAGDDILGNLTFEMKQGVRSTFLAVREYARSRFPQQTADLLDFAYAFKVTKEDEPSGGSSAGLPTAMAFLSVFLQQPLAQDVAWTGEIVADAHDAIVVRRVGDIALKVKGAYHKNLRAVVVPDENRADLDATLEVPRDVRDEIVLFARTLDGAAALAFGRDVWIR